MENGSNVPYIPVFGSVLLSTHLIGNLTVPASAGSPPVNYDVINANSSGDGNGTGTLIERITVIAVGTVVDGAVYLWVYNGVTNVFTYYDSVQVRAGTAYRSIDSDFLSGTSRPMDLWLPSNYGLIAAQYVGTTPFTQNDAQLEVMAFGADF